jgi:hypothetical protein
MKAQLLGYASERNALVRIWMWIARQKPVKMLGKIVKSGALGKRHDNMLPCSAFPCVQKTWSDAKLGRCASLPYPPDSGAITTGLPESTCCHTFRATGITDYLTNGGRIEVAQRMAGHSNAKTTDLYDRRNDDVSVGKVERIGI